MTQAERERRKAAWSKLTQEDQEKFEEKREQILQCWIDENEKTIEMLKSEGKWKSGLDGVYPELLENSKEYKQQMNELLKEYGLDFTI